MQLVPALSDMENYWGFQGYSPFHSSLPQVQIVNQDNCTRIFDDQIFQEFYDDTSTELFVQYIYKYIIQVFINICKRVLLVLKSIYT